MISREQKYGALIGIMIALLIASFMLTAGCAAFQQPPPALELELEKNTDDNTTSVKLKTGYELAEGGRVSINKETGEYEIVLNSATTKDTQSGVMAVVLEMMRMMQQMYLGAAVPVQPTNQPE